MNNVFLGTCLILLLAGNAAARDTNTIQAEVLTKTSSSWNGDELPDYPTAKPEITILKITIPSGAQLPMHEHPVINAGVLLAGELTVVTQDQDVLHLKSGDPIVEVVNKWHTGRNEGSEPAVIIVFYAGTKELPLSIEKP